MQPDFDPVGTFTAVEMEGALAWPPRTIELLEREKQMYGRVVEGRRGREARYNQRGFFRCIMAAGLAPISGGRIVQAQRLVAAIAPLLEANHFCLPYGEGNLAVAVRGKVATEELYWPGDDRVSAARLVDAARHHGIDVCSASRGDFLAVILDGSYVGWAASEGPGFMLLDGKHNRIEPVLRFHHPARGQVEIEEVQSEAAEALFIERQKNAESLLTINVSLMIRRVLVAALDRRRDLERA